jgi:hypothetical protein
VNFVDGFPEGFIQVRACHRHTQVKQISQALQSGLHQSEVGTRATQVNHFASANRRERH